MQLIKTAVAGTMESGDILVTIEPRDSGGITLGVSRSVMQQFGRQVEGMNRKTPAGLGGEHAGVHAVDKGALDCTVRARVSAAAFRSAESTDYTWKGAK